MAAATFYDPAKSEEGNLSLTTSLQTIETGQAGSATDIVALVLTNESSNSGTVTLADDAGNTIVVIGYGANAGQGLSTPPCNLLIPPMVGIEENPFGGYNYHLASGKKLQAKCDSVTGGARKIFWKSKTF